MFQHRSDSTQVKRNLTSSITNLVCELLHNLQSDSDKDFMKLENIRKISALGWDIVPSLHSRN